MLNDQHNSASYMPLMDGMRVAVYLLYLMLVLYIWAVAFVVFAFLWLILALTQCNV